MARKEFLYKGLNEEQVKKLSISEYSKLIPSRLRRSLSRGYTEQQKAVLKKIEKGKKTVKTHARDLVIVPQMLGTTIKVYNGKEYFDIEINLEKMGHYLGEFSQTRKTAKHNSPGVGASKSSKTQGR